MNELKYPDECATCKADACSGCGHRQKRADAIHKYYDQIMEKCSVCGKPLKKTETLKHNGRITGYLKQYECGYRVYSAVLL